MFHPWQEPSVKKMFVVSIVFHLMLVGLLYLVSTKRDLRPRSVYYIDLVSLSIPQKAKQPPRIKKVVAVSNPIPPKPLIPKVEKMKTAPRLPELQEKPEPLPAESERPEIVAPEIEQPGATETIERDEAAVSVPSVQSVIAGVDAPNFEFPYYLKLIQGKIGSLWSPPNIGMPRDAKEVVVSFTLVTSGKVREVKVEKSSGNAFFDQAALRAVYNASPMPPLPKGFTDPDLKVHFSFVLGKHG